MKNLLHSTSLPPLALSYEFEKCASRPYSDIYLVGYELVAHDVTTLNASIIIKIDDGDYLDITGKQYSKIKAIEYIRPISDYYSEGELKLMINGDVTELFDKDGNGFSLEDFMEDYQEVHRLIEIDLFEECVLFAELLDFLDSIGVCL